MCIRDRSAPAAAVHGPCPHARSPGSLALWALARPHGHACLRPPGLVRRCRRSLSARLRPAFVRAWRT
eukprot:2133962-Alexandrium_andersonii.AAC.1